MRKYTQNFRRGHKGVVFNCDICDRRTRLSTQCGDSSLCSECWELAGCKNTVLDGGKVEEVAGYRDGLVAKAVKRGGNLDKIKAGFKILWTEKPEVRLTCRICGMTVKPSETCSVCEQAANIGA